MVNSRGSGATPTSTSPINSSVDQVGESSRDQAGRQGGLPNQQEGLGDIHGKPKRVSRKQIPETLRGAVWAKSNGVCAYCKITMDTRKQFTVDHVIPVSRGGTDDPDNLVACCKSCNSKKHDRDVELFLSAAGKPLEATTMRLTDDARHLLKLLSQKKGISMTSVIETIVRKEAKEERLD